MVGCWLVVGGGLVALGRTRARVCVCVCVCVYVCMCVCVWWLVVVRGGVVVSDITQHVQLYNRQELYG
jgi:hypothetical protein